MAEIVIINAATGERTERDYTPEEATQREADALAEAERVASEAQAEAERVAGVQAAQAELKGLGLSDAAVAAISRQPYPYVV